ncbi:DUF4232 domain-containing protein [Agromyces lapidis]|uniref:DUF4232 domain-containing protein n=1 Tax=Agromyces lapidis TaxID=279574 RepID=A0ABV5SKY9_9MICO|nr:DUF4232 domain-containing protein [Agromyces lapidis]
MTRAAATAAALFVAVLALGGCAATAPAAESRATVEASPSPSREPDPTLAPPSAGPTPVDPTGPAGDGTVAVRDQETFSDDAVDGPGLGCDDSQFALAVVPLPDESGAGSFGFELVFTNTADRDCVFEGWPGLIAIDAAGVEVGWPARAEYSTTTPVVLDANGGVATAHVRATQAGAQGCEPIEAAGLRARIASDGTGGGIDAPYAITVCGGAIPTMAISPLVAG